MTVQERVRALIVDDLGWAGPPDQLTDDFGLIDNQVIDSMGIFELVAFLEEHYGIEVQDDELIPSNFETLGAIAELVESKTG